MAYEPKDGSGSLFKNDKGGNDKRPDYRGDIMLDGKVYELAAWIKEGNKGKFMSLSGKPKEARDEQSRSQTRRTEAQKGNPAPTFEDDPDSVPF